MTAEFQYMMHLAGCAALGSTPNPPPEGIDWAQVLVFANEQTVLPLVQYAMKRASFEIPEEHRKKAAASLNALAVQGVVRRMGILQVLEELERQGITAVVIKGFAIARDYAQPDVRISSDADIYIREEDEARALEIFKGFGFTYKERELSHKDTTLLHPRFGMVELHVRLFEEFIHDIWYEKKGFRILEPYQKEEAPDGSFFVFGDTDHFLYVLEHMMKHFIMDGLSLRMMLDVGVLLQKRGPNMNRARVEEFLAQRRYQEALRVFLWILGKYCGFSFPDQKLELTEEPLSAAALLEEMECGGVLGFKIGDSNSQNDGMRIYNSKLMKEQKSWMTSWKSNNRNLFGLLAPPMAIMKEKYPCLQKAPILYPLMILHRLVVRGGYHVGKRDLELKNWQFSVEESKLKPSSGTRRAELFRQLDMM